MKTHLKLLIPPTFLTALLFAGSTAAQTPNPNGVPMMKAIVYHRYGSPDVLRLEEIEKPVPNDNQVLVKVHAASLNPYDWHFIRGTPYIMRLEAGLQRPKIPRAGTDFAGTVEAIGKSVTHFKPGDDVFGVTGGAFAEYACASERAIALKPAGVTFEQAASVPIAGVTALQALRDSGKLQVGQKVLINGASGGVGTFAVQIAKSMGAEVTGVCSGRNAELVRGLGADHVIDYQKEDFAEGAERYDLILDNVGTQPLLGFKKVLKPNGICVLIGGGGPDEGRWIGPLTRPIKALLMSPFIKQKMSMMMAKMKGDDLAQIADLIQSGKVTPVIDRRYKLSEVPEAVRYSEEGHARGKVVVNIDDETAANPATHPAGALLSDRTVLLTVFAVVFVLPLIAAFMLHRRFREQNPEKRGYRWGFYFSILSFIAGIFLGVVLDSGVVAIIMCGAIYGALAWFFAQRQRWAWVALTILTFNPVAWIINAIYLWRRWSEDSVATGTI